MTRIIADFRNSSFISAHLRNPRRFLAALCSGVYGLALARFLFESQPQTLSLFNTWPGVLALAASGALACAVLVHVRGAALFTPLPLLLPLVSLLSPEVNLVRAQTLLIGSGLLFLFFLLGDKSGAGGLGRAVPALLLLLGLLYLPTVSPVVGEADPFEFQVSVARLGVAHGNGYPLLLLVGKVFELLPLGGTQAWRVNLSTAVAMALAAVGVMIVARRLGASPLVAFLAALAFGVSPSVWARAVEIEAYALNAALMTILLYLGLRLIEIPRDAVNAQPSASVLYALAFVFGLSLTNHLTSLMLAPALAAAGGRWLAAGLRNTENTSQFVIRHSSFILLFFVLGLAVYLYLPLRWPAINHGQTLSLQQFIYFLRGGEAAGQFDPWLPLKEPQRFAYVFRKISGEFGWAGFGLMVLGIVSLLINRLNPQSKISHPKSTIIFLLAAYTGYTYFVLAYNPPEPDFSDFFIATYVLAAVFIALGLQFLITTLKSQTPLRFASGAIIANLIPTLFLLLPLSSIWLTLPTFNYAEARARYALGQFTLNQPLAQNAALLADPKRFAVPYYLQSTERIRPDLDIVVLPDEASYRAALDERLAAGQTVYLARYLAGLGAAYSLRSVGPLAEVSPQPFTSPPPIANPLSATLADGIQLTGYKLPSLISNNSNLPSPLLTLYWHTSVTPPRHLAVYLRLLDPARRAVWQSAGSVPVNGLYPTNAWRPGEHISDFYEVAPEAGLPPGTYHLQVGLFPPFEPDADNGWADVASLTVVPSGDPLIPHPLRAQFGAQWLLGYDAPESALPGSPVAVTLYWARGASDSVTAFGETRSLLAWPPGAIAPLTYSLQAPASGEFFPLSVSTGQPARCGWLARASESGACALPPIRLTGAALPADAVNFDGQLVLRRALLETPQVARGNSVRVTLEWQALRTMRESYTVFVHLVGPDGRLYGQKDYWPVEGTRLTPSWQPGEIIRDPYTIPLPADAPPGAYTVHIGLYLLETLERLPVLNADGSPLDDKFILAGLVVE